MIMGLVPSGRRGVIFKDWKPISVKEYEALDYPIFYGTDFGFSNDPAGVVEVKQHNDNIYVREIIYQTGLINQKLSEQMELKGIKKQYQNFGDGAEPKSVAEFQSYGWYMTSSDKGAGSRKAGVDFLLGKNVFYTEDSVNLINEMQNYCWALDRNKEPTNEPADGNDHLLDALRYAVYTKAKQPYIGF
jgi:phage terminase large subunit